MSIVVVGGTKKGAGKTTLICALIAALPEIQWAAIKITGHDHGLEQPIHEETEPGQGTDTARYLAAGAHRAFLITAPDAQFSFAPLLKALDPATNLIVESNRSIESIEPDLSLAILSGQITEAKPSFAPSLQRADAIVVAPGTNLAQFQMPPRALLFGLRSLDQVPPEMQAWLRSRLAQASQADN